jgi:hypothetical protein
MYPALSSWKSVLVWIRRKGRRERKEEEEENKEG